jgi:ABC-type Fe3+ transport system permease subunit
MALPKNDGVISYYISGVVVAVALLLLFGSTQQAAGQLFTPMFTRIPPVLFTDGSPSTVMADCHLDC